MATQISVIIGLVDGLLTLGDKAITSTFEDLLLVELIWINCSEIYTKTHKNINKLHLKMSSV